MLYGTIYDARTKQPIPAATIAVLDNGEYTGAGTVADGEGKYSLNVQDQMNDVQATALGYGSVTTAITDGQKDFYLTSYITQLPGVTVTAPKPTNNMNLPVAPGPTWAEMKPLLIGLAVIVAASVVIGHSQAKTKRK